MDKDFLIDLADSAKNIKALYAEEDDDITKEATLEFLDRIFAEIDTIIGTQDCKNNLEQKVEAQTKELAYNYFHDLETKLPNAKMLQRDLQEQQYRYMILLDISNFATINKAYGKVFANSVIVHTSQALQHHIHGNTKLYKIESDRFIILLKETSVEQMHNYCEQIISFFDVQNVEIEDVEINISFNIGVADICKDMLETLVNSEFALDKSKKLGSRHYEVFDEDLTCFSEEKDAIKWLKITRDLILNENIEAYFQPIKDIEADEILKYEVLARGIADDGEVIAPANFIGPAEKLGMITSITRTMINKSFAFFKNKDFHFSINITERDLMEGFLMDFLDEKLKHFNMDPSRVTFEILENITIAKNSKVIKEQLGLLKERGFLIAIDDFGIENSNFSRLLEIDLDFIKIDGIFIQDLKTNDRNRTITRAIVNLAKTLGIKTVAEYVETREIYDIVKECGIDYAQGYYVGKPKPSTH